MRIIKEGKLPTDEIERTCHRCNTVFAYNDADVQPDQRDGAYVQCPFCSAVIGIGDDRQEIISEKVARIFKHKHVP